MIRILLVEDSVTQREIFRTMFEDDPEFTIVAEARNGREAVEKASEHSPDVVLMDIHMPVMDGIEATRAIMEVAPVPIVIASASLRKREVDLAMMAYDNGAISVIEKPDGAVLLHLHKLGPQLRNELLAASRARVKRKLDASPVSQPSTPTTAESSPRRSAALQIVGVCASTGGPPVLVSLLGALPKPLPIPVLLVQHIAKGFEEGFARWLSRSTQQSVTLATHGQRLSPGVWMGPSGKHLILSSSMRIQLVEPSSSEVHAPSGNPLFESLAKHFGERAGGVVLTGMGDDGADGLLALYRAKGTTIIQNEPSCLIWGMPKVAKEKQAAMYELEPSAIARMLSCLVQ